MKTVFEISLLFILSTTLCSCPYSSAYYLDESPTIYVEDALLGKWATFIKKPGSSREEPVKLIFSKRTDTEYNITFTGYLEDLRPFGLISADSISGTAFMSTVGGYQFLNISINSRVYIAQLKLKEDKLSLLPLLEHFTSKMIRNSTALRNSVEVHYKTRVHPMLDDDFCLRDMVKVN
ncbi:MAG TPA: hypothetical protein VK489_04965 [Ferruginibacter sp.]|nr:hypothetical protein [Ferruginibacter sp.]